MLEDIKLDVAEAMEDALLDLEDGCLREPIVCKVPARRIPRNSPAQPLPHPYPTPPPVPPPPYPPPPPPPSPPPPPPQALPAAVALLRSDPFLESHIRTVDEKRRVRERREEERRQHPVDPDAVGAPPQNSGSLHGMCAEPAGMRTGGGLMSCNQIRGGGAPSDGGDHAEGEA